MLEMRPAIFDDYPAIANLHTISWQQHYHGIFSKYFLNNQVERNRWVLWHRRMSVPLENQRVTVAIHDNALVGFACLFLDDDPVFGSLLDNLHVAASHHGLGIGRSLIETCARQLLSSNTSKLYLWVFEKNEKAKSFYERLGGIHVENIETKLEDGSSAVACRYVWHDVSNLIR